MAIWPSPKLLKISATAVRSPSPMATSTTEVPIPMAKLLKVRSERKGRTARSATAMRADSLRKRHGKGPFTLPSFAGPRRAEEERRDGRGKSPLEPPGWQGFRRKGAPCERRGPALKTLPGGGGRRGERFLP